MMDLNEFVDIPPAAVDAIGEVLSNACLAACAVHYGIESTDERIEKAASLSEVVSSRCIGNRMVGTPMRWGEYRALYAAVMKEAARIAMEGVD